MRKGWNMLDFTIVLSGLFEIVMEHFQVDGINLRILRILRILRPLKAFKTTPSLQKQINALLRSVHGILNVSAFLIFILFLFAVIGL